MSVRVENVAWKPFLRGGYHTAAAPLQDWGFKPEEIEAPPNRVTLEYTQLLLSVARGPQVTVKLGPNLKFSCGFCCLLS